MSEPMNERRQGTRQEGGVWSRAVSGTRTGTWEPSLMSDLNVEWGFAKHKEARLRREPDSLSLLCSLCSWPSEPSTKFSSYIFVCLFSASYWTVKFHKSRDHVSAVPHFIFSL